MTGVLLDSIISLQKDVQVLSLKKGKKPTIIVVIVYFSVGWKH